MAFARLWTFIVLVCLCPASYGEARFLQFRHLTAEDGLSRSLVRALLQDSRGFMWLGTSNGLDRYDGYRFKTYQTRADDPHSLINSNITCLYEDSEKRLWVGTEGGLSLYRRDTDDFISFADPSAGSRSAARVSGLGPAVRSIVEGDAGELWIGADAGLVRFSAETGRSAVIAHDPNNPDSLSSSEVRFVVRDAGGRLWVATVSGLNRFDPRSGKAVRYRHDASNPASLLSDNLTQLAVDGRNYLWVGSTEGVCRLNLASSQAPVFERFPALAGLVAFCLYSDRDGRIWIGLENGGLCRYDYETGTFGRYRSDPNDASSLNNESINCIHQDRTGDIWVGTFSGGVNITRKNADAIVHFKTVPGAVNSLSYNSVTDFLEDRQGFIWVCTDGGGVDRFDPRTSGFTHFTTKNSGLNRDAVLDVYEDRQGNLWIGTWDGGLNLYDRQRNTFRYFTKRTSRLPNDNVFAIHEDDRGRLILATNPDGLVIFSATSGECKGLGGARNATVVFKDSDGDFLIGSESGLLVLNARTDTVVVYRHDDADPATIAGDRVQSIESAGAGAFFVATEQGLDRFEKGTGRFTPVKAEFPTNEVSSLIKDTSGRIWAGTAKGLYRFDPATGRAKAFSKADGTLGNEFNRDAVLMARNGAIYLGGVNNGFNIVYPDRISENTTIPPVVLTDFRLGNKSAGLGGDSPLQKQISELKELRLSYQQSSFAFEFAALDFSAPGQNQYAYRLEGFDTEWNSVGAQRTAVYTNLSPGDYVFRVRGSNNDGHWNNEGASIAVQIAPPFWAEAWFRLLAGALIVGAVLAVTRSARRRRKVLVAMNRKLSEEIDHARRAEGGRAALMDQMRLQEHYLNSNILRMLAEIEKFSDGDLTIRLQAERQDELGNLIKGLNEAVAAVRSVLLEVAGLVVVAAEAGRTLSVDATAMAAGAEEQSAQAEAVSAAIQEMAGAILETSRSASVASENAKKAGAVAKDGGTVLAETLVSMTKITDNIGRTSELVDRLAQSSASIGKIVNVIESIAFQTNLLALNAAVEAARAGDAGRGFAVVAGEVKHLAERTRKSLQDIKDTISGIQREIKAITGAASSSTAEADRGRQLALQAGAALKEVIQASEDAVVGIEQLATAAGELSSNSENISNSASSIAAAAGHVAGGTQSVAQTAQELQKMTGDLQARIGKFRVQ
jgi:methyl-accepting chemotaxis protein/ligand-binding sensor domain-containing protein